MDKFWFAWVQASLRRNCDPEEVFAALLKENLSLSSIRNAMGATFPDHSDKFGAIIKAGAGISIETMRKRDSLVMIQRALATLNPKSRLVERRSKLTRAEFLSQYYSANRPVILCDLMVGWKAVENWTSDYLKAVCGDIMVGIQSRRNSNPMFEIDRPSGCQQIRFDDYLDMVFGPAESNDYYLTVQSDFWRSPEVRALLDDLEMFPEYLEPNTSGKGVFLCFGPKGAVTPLRHYTRNILRAQVSGRERVKLIPANEIDLIYNHQGVYSQVDCDNPDYDRFPKYRKATVLDIELEPGEVLFIPVGWWHHSRVLDASISVSFVNFVFRNSFQWVHPQGRGGALPSNASDILEDSDF